LALKARVRQTNPFCSGLRIHAALIARKDEIDYWVVVHNTSRADDVAHVAAVIVDALRRFEQLELTCGTTMEQPYQHVILS